MMGLQPTANFARWLLTGVLMLIGGSLQADPGATAAQPAASPVPLVERSLLLGFLADNSTATLIDARSPDEYAAQHVTGAVNIPFDDLDEYAAQLPADSAEPIIIYCRSGKRARLLQKQLIERGFSNVHVLPPRQLFWTDEIMVFNCGVTDEVAPAAVMPSTVGAGTLGPDETGGAASR
jgi:phage shock protein E